jgi:flagellar hook-basal body complex protein FliE
MALNLNTNNNIGEIFTKDLLQTKNVKTDTNSEVDFGEMLKSEIESTNKTMESAEKASVDIATGTVKDLAKANIAIEKADLKMQMMLEVRNKAINAYKELSKIQV